MRPERVPSHRRPDRSAYREVLSHRPGVLSGQIVRPTVSDRDNPAPTLDSQSPQTKLDTAVPTPGDAEATLGSAPAVEVTARRDLASIGPYRLVKKLGEGGRGRGGRGGRRRP